MRLKGIVYFRALGALVINTLVPGAGFIVIGDYRVGVTVQAILASIVMALCWTRWIFTPAGCKALMILIALTYLFNSIFVIIRILKGQPTWSVTNTLLAFLFSGLCLGAFALGFKTKDQWLGVHVNFVPSISMQPILQPGDFILVDTQSAILRTRKIGQVVVFRDKNRSKFFYVKRIGKKPSHLNNNSTDLFYMLGDNSKASTDSRSFGMIHREQIIGEVKLVLFNLDQPERWCYLLNKY
jgi:signal peptidase I